jgi:phosphoribosylglycinamide formyltransferase-1
MRIAICGSGAGTTAAHVIDAAHRGEIDAEVCLVVGNNSTSGIFDVARDRGVPTLHLSSATHPDPTDLDAAMLAAFEEAGADVVVLAGYMKLLGPRVLARFEDRVLNTHPALLPAYGGQGMYGDRVHAAVLADGAAVTGATVHVVTAGYDEGPVVAQAEVPVEPDDTVGTLRARVQQAEKDLLVRCLRERSAGG